MKMKKKKKMKKKNDKNEKKKIYFLKISSLFPVVRKLPSFLLIGSLLSKLEQVPIKVFDGSDQTSKHAHK